MKYKLSVLLGFLIIASQVFANPEQKIHHNRDRAQYEDVTQVAPPPPKHAASREARHAKHKKNHDGHVQHRETKNHREISKQHNNESRRDAHTMKRGVKHHHADKTNRGQANHAHAKAKFKPAKLTPEQRAYRRYKKQFSQRCQHYEMGSVKERHCRAKARQHFSEMCYNWEIKMPKTKRNAYCSLKENY